MTAREWIALAAKDNKSSGGLIAGLVLLVVATMSSLALSLTHLSGLSLPGCGEGSPCAEATSSAWATIPGVGWPVSYVGLAYFVGLLVAWTASRGGASAALRLLVRVGAAASVGFVIVMIVEGHLCSYCVVTHVCNIAFWILVERGPNAARGAGHTFALGAAVFVVATAALGVIEQRERGRAAANAEKKLAVSVAKIAVSAAVSADAQPSSANAAQPAGETAIDVATPDASDNDGAGFTGRYPLGPKRAAIRVVMFTDYQCKQCRRIEGELARLFEQRDDMSISIKHFPMCSDCNRRATRRLHPNACWAARAAEAAGILRGSSGFWRMHTRLFERGGAFTRDELRAVLSEFGYDIGEFERTMTGDETLERVKADVEQGIGLGVWFTPTIYINGVELRGWEAPKAIERAVAALAATNPEPKTAANDHPPPAVEKLVGDWAAARHVSVPEPPEFRRSGDADAAVSVALFGDFLNPGTAEADASIRAAMNRRDDVRYEYHYFPFNKDCNPVVRVATKYPYACRAAATAEAAGRLGGADAYWAMHAQLLDRQASLDDAVVREIAGDIGIDADTLLAEMETADVQQAILTDARRARGLGAKAVPTIFVNGRRVPRWKLEDRNVLPDIIAQAAGSGKRGRTSRP